MKLSALLKGIETESRFADVEIERVTDKSDGNLKNALFVCIDGRRCDGHAMAREALKKGALAVVTERDIKIAEQIIVSDTRCALSEIAANFYGRPADCLHLIGVTGTNGKTSTAFFIKGILDAAGKKCGIIGTVKNNTGNGDTDAALTTPEPLELQRLFRETVDSGCEYCVMEVSSQALSQRRVCGLTFDVSVLTNITEDHLDYHGDMQSYIDAKLSLFNMSRAAIINLDDENIRSNLKRLNCPVKTFSAVSNRADYTARNIRCGIDGVRYELVSTNSISRVHSGVLGRFTIYNTACAMCTAAELGVNLDDASSAVSQLHGVDGRAEVVECDKPFTVMIDYAHTPDGLKNILNSVRELTDGRVITVFGCGGDREREKRAEMGRIAGELSDIAIVTSDNPRTENPILIINDILCGMEKIHAKLAVIENRREAIGFALKKARAGDLVLIAGKGHEKYQIIGNEKTEFDERKIVKELL